MAGRLVNLRVLAQRARAPQAYLPTRGGGGGPVKMGRPIDHPVRLIPSVLCMLSRASHCSRFHYVQLSASFLVEGLGDPASLLRPIYYQCNISEVI